MRQEPHCRVGGGRSARSILLRAAGFLLTLVLAACNSIPTDYKGSDAGTVLVGIGVVKGGYPYSSFALLFRSTDEWKGDPALVPSGRFVFHAMSFFGENKPDYDSPDEFGVVIASRLRPGNYEVFNFDVFFNGGMVQSNFKSRQPISIPFAVRPGEAVYLGNYQARSRMGKNVFGLSVPAGAVFAVEDRMDQAVGIAKKKIPLLPATVANITPSVQAIANPYFVAPQSPKVD